MKKKRPRKIVVIHCGKHGDSPGMYLVCEHITKGAKAHVVSPPDECPIANIGAAVCALCDPAKLTLNAFKFCVSCFLESQGLEDGGVIQ